jgi:hypothetical protein
METKFASIEQKFDTTDKSIITIKKKSPLIGALALAAGVVSVVLVPMVNTEGGTGGALLIVLAITFFVWGLLATFIRKKYYFHIQYAVFEIVGSLSELSKSLLRLVSITKIRSIV